jgi:uncharacterized sulfatase
MNYTFSLLPLLLMVATAAAADSKPPNIVLIISDDQSYTDYGFMGHPAIETPHLDKLAKESAVFRRGYVPTALCRPALMTLVTGLYSHQNKTTGNNPANTPANKAHAEKAGKDIREVLISHVDQTGALPRWQANAIRRTVAGSTSNYLTRSPRIVSLTAPIGLSRG